MGPLEGQSLEREPGLRRPVEDLLEELTSWAPRERLRAFRAWHRGSLSLIHLSVLALLEAEGPVSMGRIADELDVSHASATGIIDRMEERGIVERRPASDDRRVTRLHITDAGIAVSRELLARRRDQPRKVLADLTDEDVAAFLRGVRAMRAARERLAQGEETERAATGKPESAA
jgi:DNA-binding MarR family transcriptional regulator